MGYRPPINSLMIGLAFYCTVNLGTEAKRQLSACTLVMLIATKDHNDSSINANDALWGAKYLLGGKRHDKSKLAASFE